MKKVFITLSAILLVSVSFASGHVDSVRYLTTKAGRNWFISAEGSLNWWNGSMLAPSGYKTDYATFNDMGFGGGLALGKWINHKVGVRLAYDVNSAHSYILGPHNGLTHIHFLYDDRQNPVEGSGNNAVYATSFMYHNLHVDGLFSPVDFFQGYYNPKRVYTPVFFVGMGLSGVSEHIFVTSSLLNDEQVNFELSFAAGLINNFRLSDYLDLHLDLKYALTRWNIDSWTGYEFNGYYYPDGTLASDQLLPNAAGEKPTYFRPQRVDQNFSVALGLTYYIRGRIYELPYNYEKEMREMSERIKNLEDELAVVPEPVVVPADTVIIYSDKIEAVSYPFSIFFNLDSYQLMSKRDLVNLRSLCDVAKENNWKLRLRGSCDSATASPEYNQKLSENRCRKIMMELLDMGFPEENIVLEPVGGIKELDPAEYDRRVLIDVIKYRD